MNLGLLFLKVNTLGVITLSELDWITNHQSEFSRLDMALVIKIGRLMDSGVVEIDNSCLLYTSPSPRDLSTSRMPSSA